MGNVLKHWVLLLTWTFNDYHCVGVCFPPRWCYTWFKIHNTQDAYKFMIPSTLINTTWEGLCATRSSAWASRDPSLATNSLPRPMGRGSWASGGNQWPATSTQVGDCRTGIRTQSSCLQSSLPLLSTAPHQEVGCAAQGSAGQSQGSVNVFPDFRLHGNGFAAIWQEEPQGTSQPRPRPPCSFPRKLNASYWLDFRDRGGTGHSSPLFFLLSYLFHHASTFVRILFCTFSVEIP